MEHEKIYVLFFASSLLMGKTTVLCYYYDYIIFHKQQIDLCFLLALIVPSLALRALFIIPNILQVSFLLGLSSF